MNVSVCTNLTENDQTVDLALTGTNVGNPSTAILTINDTASRFRNATGIVINQNAAADPYPAIITVQEAFNHRIGSGDAVRCLAVDTG